VNVLFHCRQTQVGVVGDFLRGRFDLDARPEAELRIALFLGNFPARLSWPSGHFALSVRCSGAQSPAWEEVFPELRPAVPGEGGEELPLFYPLNYGTMIWKE